MRLHHVALRCADPEAAEAFYAGLLGLEILERHRGDDGTPRSVWLGAGDTILMIERRLAGAGSSEGSGHLLAFAVDDLDVWPRRLEQAGVTIDGRSEWSLYFRDPDGHRVAVTAYRR